MENDYSHISDDELNNEVWKSIQGYEAMYQNHVN